MVESKVWVKGKGRTLPEAKYSKWTVDRIPLEQEKPENCQEVYLCFLAVWNTLASRSYWLMNKVDFWKVLFQISTLSRVSKFLPFGSIKDSFPEKGDGYELQTAGLHDGILDGTFRKVVLDAVRGSSMTISVNESCPLLSESDTWTEAFVSNRQVL